MKKKLLITCICLLYSTIGFADTNMYDIFYGIQKSIDTVSDIQQLRRNAKEDSNPKQIPQETKTQKEENISNEKVTNVCTTNLIDENSVLYPIYYPEVGMYGYENAKGQSKIPPKYENAMPFSEGLAAVYNGYRWGYIDSNGVYVITPKYGAYSAWEKEIMNPFVNGTCAVFLGSGNAYGFADERSQEYAIIDKKGNVLKYFDSLSPTWYGAEEGALGEYHAQINERGYIVDSQGNILRQEF